MSGRVIFQERTGDLEPGDIIIRGTQDVEVVEVLPKSSSTRIVYRRLEDGDDDGVCYFVAGSSVMQTVIGE